MLTRKLAFVFTLMGSCALSDQVIHHLLISIPNYKDNPNQFSVLQQFLSMYSEESLKSRLLAYCGIAAILLCFDIPN